MQLKTLAAAAAAGAAAAYFLDPARGAERRQRIGGTIRALFGQVEGATDEAFRTVDQAADTVQHVAARGREAAEAVEDAIVDAGGVNAAEPRPDAATPES